MRMALRPKTYDPLDLAIAEALLRAVKESGVSRRELGERAGMSINRLGIILRQEPPPATVGEVGAIAGALGLTAREVIADAEARTVTVTGHSSAPDAGEVPKVRHARVRALSLEASAPVEPPAERRGARPMSGGPR